MQVTSCDEGMPQEYLNLVDGAVCDTSVSIPVSTNWRPLSGTLRTLRLLRTPHRKTGDESGERDVGVSCRQSLKIPAEQAPHQQDSRAWVELGQFKPLVHGLSIGLT
jgi:hypothetical protein